MQVNMLEAKNNLSALIVAVERDEEVIIARSGIPVAKIIKYRAPKVAPPGVWKSQVPYSADWNSPEANADVESLFAGSNDATIA